MRILMLNPSFSAGGYMHNLCNALADAGVEVDLYTGPHFERSAKNWSRVAYRPIIRFYRWTQVRSYEPGPLRGVWRGLRFLGHLWSMARAVVAAGRYDVVHVHFLPVPSLDRLWLRLFARRAAVVYTVHNLLPHDAEPTDALQELFRGIYDSAHHLIGHTHRTILGLIEDFGIPADRVSRVAMGNANHLRDLQHTIPPESLGLQPSDPPLVLMLGEIRHNKGLDVLLRAAALVKQRGIRFRLIIAGAATVDPEPYLRLARELSLGDCVEFRLGYIEEEAVPTYFNAATVVALPYRQIDQSLVAVSAISLGRPVVATRIAGLAELVAAGACGLLVDVGDVAGLAEALARFLTDPALQESCRTKALQFADGPLDWGRLAEQTVAVYRDAIRRAAGARESLSDR